MEDSVSVGRAVVASKGSLDSPEESGWTTYFEELSSRREHSFSSSFGSSSMVSDAASFPAWKLSHQKHVVANPSVGGSTNMPKKLSFKKIRAKEISQDDSLEDTASSPVNSPKVTDLTPIDLNHRADHHLNSSLGKEGTLEHYADPETDERCEMSFHEKSHHADLKKKGLCLVHLSMLVNYLG